MNLNPYAIKYLKMKLNILEKIKKKNLKKVEACLKLSISRPTLDKWLSRYKRFGEEGLYPQKRRKYKSPQNRTSSDIEDLVVKLSQKYWSDGVEILSDKISTPSLQYF